MSRPPRLRIAVAVHTFPVLTETFVLEPVLQLLERGHDVQILALYRGAAEAEHRQVREHRLYERTLYLIDDVPGRGKLRKLRKAVAKVLHGPLSRVPWLRILRDLSSAEIIRVAPQVALAAAGAASARPDGPLRYDIVHSHMGPVGLVMEHLRRWGLLQGPLVATFHGSDVLVEPSRHPRRFYQRLFSGADLLTANTEFLKERLQVLGAPAEKCWRLPVGVDPADFEYRPRSLTPHDPLRLLTVARLDPLKGIRYGIEVVHRLRAEGRDVRYTVIGEGPERGKLQAMIASLGLQDVVELAGPMHWHGVKDAYLDHHVFILPGVVHEDGGQEAQGRVLIEAQATGMPVVSTDVGGVREAVAPDAGVLVPERDVEALHAAVLSLLEQPERWEELGRRGRAFVEAHYDSRALMEGLVERYEVLAAGAGTR